MGRKGKKRGSQQARTPMRTSTILPPQDSAPPALSHDGSESQAPLIDMDAPPSEPQEQPEPELQPDVVPELMSFDVPPQLSPPPSPIPEERPIATQPGPRPRGPSPVASPTARRQDSFVRIDSPPDSPPPSSPAHRPADKRRKPVMNDNRQNQGSFEAYGTNPHIVACVSCNAFCTLTGSRGVVDKHKLCLDDSNDDTFFPTVCSECENYRGFLWLKVEGGRSPPGQRQQYPETLHSSMLAAWPLYVAVRDRFGVKFNPNSHEHTVVVTRSRDWWREGVLTNDKSLVLMWKFDHASGMMREKSPMPRKDEFFGGPER